MKFEKMSLEEIISLIKEDKTTKEEVFNYFLNRIEKIDPKIKSFVFVNKDWLNKEDTKDTPLAWVPIWIKDIFCENWITTSCSSNMIKDFQPPYDSTVIKKLKEAWMSSIWKLNMDEFAMGSTGENSAFFNTLNPWWTSRIPWGSSSWSAASVAAWLVPAALWTDTWWSIRQPASMCWIVWFKPSYGRNSRFWVMAMASSLDCPWYLTKTVKDSALLYNITNWEDELENTSIPWTDIIKDEIWKTKDLSNFTFWIPKEYFEEWIDEGVKNSILESIEKLKKAWAKFKEISLPMTKYAIATYYIIMPAEVSTNLSRYDWIRYGHVSEKPFNSIDEMYINNRWEWFWEEAKSRIVLWSYVLSAWFYDAYFKKATKVRTLIIEDFKKAFEEVDAIVWPVSPSVAWEIWEKIDDPLKMYLSDAYTIPASLAGLPAISIPCSLAESQDSKKEKLPVWLQIITPLFEEERLFEIAQVAEKVFDFQNKFPLEIN